MTQYATQYLAIGGRTNDAFGRREALRVRVGYETSWTWKDVTDDEYQIMLDALNAPRDRQSPDNATSINQETTLMTEPFWMIYGMGQGAPTMKHDTFEAARTEAERLARFNPGIEFFVLRSVACAKKVDVEFRHIRPEGIDVTDGELPF